MGAWFAIFLCFALVDKWIKPTFIQGGLIVSSAFGFCIIKGFAKKEVFKQFKPKAEDKGPDAKDNYNTLMFSVSLPDLERQLWLKSLLSPRLPC